MGSPTDSFFPPGIHVITVSASGISPPTLASASPYMLLSRTPPPSHSLPDSIPSCPAPNLHPSNQKSKTLESRRRVNYSPVAETNIIHMAQEPKKIGSKPKIPNTTTRSRSECLVGFVMTCSCLVQYCTTSPIPALLQNSNKFWSFNGFETRCTRYGHDLLYTCITLNFAITKQCVTRDQTT